VVQENFDTHPMEGYWKLEREGGSQNAEFLKNSMNIEKLEFAERQGCGVQTKTLY